VLKRFFLIAFVCSFSSLLAQVPSATITVPSTSLCTGSSVVFNTTTTNTPIAYTWTVLPSYGVTLSATDQPTIAVIFTKPGAYTMSLTVSNGSGTTTTVRTVSVTQTPSAAFSASLNPAGFPSQIVLTNFSSSATTYTWSYSETAATDTTFNAVHSYSASGSYSLMLVASNGTFGCNDTSSYSFYISDSSGITLPNVFTPNYDDINDVFKPVARGITSMKVGIYSRYGNYVYGWESVNGSWDGHTTSGQPCSDGTYFCILEATGFDGKSYKLKTTITLTR
jgi:gliding motility-associated-like protein